MLKNMICLAGALLLVSGCGAMQKMAVREAQMEINQGNYKKAQELLQRAERYSKDDPEKTAEILYLRGSCYEGLDQKSEALNAYQELNQRFPESTYNEMGKARVRSLQESPATTEQNIKQAQACLPQDKTSTYYWFPGMHTPPPLAPALPQNFEVFPNTQPDNNPKANITFDMYSGVLWTDKKTGSEYAFQKKKSYDKITQPIFIVRLSAEVGQLPGTNNFTIEKDIAMIKNYNVGEKLFTEKKMIGGFPALIVTGKRADGTIGRSLWLGCNSPDGWTIYIDYRTPVKASEEEQKQYAAIWNDFINKTVAKEIPSEPGGLAARIKKMKERLPAGVTTKTISAMEWATMKPLLPAGYGNIITSSRYNSNDITATFNDNTSTMVLAIKTVDGKSAMIVDFSYSGEMKSFAEREIKRK